MKTTKKNERLERAAVAVAYVAGIVIVFLQIVHYDLTILKPAGL